MADNVRIKIEVTDARGDTYLHEVSDGSLTISTEADAEAMAHTLELGVEAVLVGWRRGFQSVNAA